jgi:tetratricopeptide (TPR) repeat protein
MTRDEIFEHETALCDQLLGGDTPEAAVEPLLRAQSVLQPISRATVGQKARLACLLVDVGAQVGREDLVRSGLAIFTENYAEMASDFRADSLEYNIGNAKKSLYDIERSQSKDAFRAESIARLTEAKNHYWRAVKLGAIDPQLLVNLANTLDQCARVVEALLWFDRALIVDPGFGMAHLNRGQALLFLNDISGTYSISQLYEAEKCFQLAEGSGQLPEHLMVQARKYRDGMAKNLLKLGWSGEDIEFYEAQHKKEYEEHDPYWRFCLSNYLVLSEHALYCQCIGARRDDLSILKSSGAIGGGFVSRLELLLNRVKSEFVLARSLFYQSLLGNDEGWDLHASEGTFTELHEGEDIGLRPEFLRTSFRLCFGILDRIAQGLKELYELADPKEALSFESFWRPQDQRKQGNEIRWRRINEQHNMGLVALYSLATDLNRVRGEWGHFKEFRNDLEHGLFVLLEREGAELSPDTTPLRIPFKSMATREFRDRALQMLHFTASAIFSFAFCVRDEGRRVVCDRAVTVERGKKKIGKE